MTDINQNTLPFEETYWVIPGKFMAGEYPGRSNQMESHNRIQGLIRSGIRICIDLTKPGEINPSYREVFLEELDYYQVKGNYYHFPIYDFGIPTEEQVTCTLDLIDESVKSNQPVYLHCRAGIGRTGLIVGCYLARHGMNGKEALLEIKKLRSSMSSSWSQSPETDAQVEFVRKWRIGQ